MFDYTKAIFNKTRKELETAFTVFQFGTQIIYIAYLIFLLFSKQNNIWYLHLSLLLICIPYLVFDLITTKNIKELKKAKVSLLRKKEHKKRLSAAKEKRRPIVRIKFYASHCIKLFVLASAFYPIIVSPSTVHPLSVMCTTVMVLLWILQIVLEVIKFILNERYELFIEAIEADVSFITKPVNTVKNAFKKITGQDIEQDDDTPSRERIYLDKIVAAERNAKSAKKAAAKAERNEKISSWLDSHISKLSFKRKKKEKNAKEQELVPVNADEDETV